MLYRTAQQMTNMEKKMCKRQEKVSVVDKNKEEEEIVVVLIGKMATVKSISDLATELQQHHVLIGGGVSHHL